MHRAHATHLRTLARAWLVIGAWACLAALMSGCTDDGDAGGDTRRSNPPRGERALRAELLACDSDSSNPSAVEACLTDALEAALPSLGLRVVTIARDVAASSPRLEGACHMAMHPIGEQALAGRSAASALAVAGPIEDSQCSAGYVHGLLVGAGDASSSARLDGLVAACDLEQEPAGAAGCVHGLGHVARRRARGVPAAVAWCDRIAQDRSSDCTLGLFHDLHLSAAGSTSGGPAPTAAERAYTLHASACATLDLAAATSCTWRLGMERGTQAWNTSLRTAATPGAAGAAITRTCGDATWRRVRGACVTGAIRAIRGPDARIPEADMLVRTCEALARADRTECARGLFDIDPTSREQFEAACLESADTTLRSACAWWIGHLDAMGMTRVGGSTCEGLDPAATGACERGRTDVRTLGIL